MLDKSSFYEDRCSLMCDTYFMSMVSHIGIICISASAYQHIASQLCPIKSLFGKLNWFAENMYYTLLKYIKKGRRLTRHETRRSCQTQMQMMIQQRKRTLHRLPPLMHLPLIKLRNWWVCQTKFPSGNATNTANFEKAGFVSWWVVMGVWCCLYCMLMGALSHPQNPEHSIFEINITSSHIIPWWALCICALVCFSFSRSLSLSRSISLSCIHLLPQ